MIADEIAKRIINNTSGRKHFSTLYADALESTAIKLMSKSPSSTTTGMNIADTPAQRAYLASLANPAQQQAHGEEPVSRLGSSSDKSRVAPTSYAGNDNAIVDGMSVNSTDGGAFTVKRPCYTQVEGKGAGATDNARGTASPADPLKGNDHNVRETVGQSQSSKHLPNQKLPFASPVAGSEGDRA
jgi:recombination DNA repair RAD52 pathway protein